VRIHYSIRHFPASTFTAHTILQVSPAPFVNSSLDINLLDKIVLLVPRTYTASSTASKLDVSLLLQQFRQYVSVRRSNTKITIQKKLN
jgi:uncharacterized protein (DUF1499 family)